MKKIVLIGLIMSLSACATIRSGRDTVVSYMCQHKQDIIASAIAIGDYATIKAVEAYCPDPIETATNAAIVAGRLGD